ncbi:hypothetical protein MSPP1_002214 [Malassezia sp. CBS 17886]|nr:hypothetical protein MSPP1_002214 [Malassezia sp. CBS 17886]
MSQAAASHQLGEWVESLLQQVENRFEEHNKQVAMRMNEMSDRIDALESSIQELVHGAGDCPPTPTPPAPLGAPQ